MNDFEWPDVDEVDPRIRVRKDRLAFFLSGAAMGVTGAYLGLVSLAMLSMDRGLGQLIAHPKLDLYLGLPLLLAHLFASVLFLGPSRETGRQPRAAVLLLITMIMMGFWAAEHARWLGFDTELSPSADDPIRTLFLRTLGLVRFLVLLDLAIHAAVTTKPDDISVVRRAAALVSLLGFGLWLMMSLEHINWRAWPLRWRGLRDLGWFMILIVSFAARALGCVLEATLCFRACANQGRELEILEAKAVEEDPFRSIHPWN